MKDTEHQSNTMKSYKDKSRKLARQLYWEQNDRESYRCPGCNRKESEVDGGFEVHHKNGQPMDNSPENHVGLCRLCHMIREGKKPSKKRIKSLLGQYQELRNVAKLDHEGVAKERFLSNGTIEYALVGVQTNKGYVDHIDVHKNMCEMFIDRHSLQSDFDVADLIYALREYSDAKVRLADDAPYVEVLHVEPI